MAIRELFSSTWDEVAALDRDRAVVVLPVGAIEAHGPHLPLGTDVLIAEAMARAGAARLSARGHEALILPTLAYTAAPFAANFPGTISLSPATVTAVLVDMARSLSGQGFRVLAIANAHLDPMHLASLADAVTAIRESGLVVAYPDLTKKRWATRLTDEFRSGACHAGQYESSVVLATRPELVREEMRTRLPRVPHSLSAAIRRGRGTFEEAGGPLAYFGDPSSASAEEGHATIEALGAILDDAVVEALGIVVTDEEVPTPHTG